LFGALRVLSDSYNNSATVQQFVWALTPVAVDSAPASYFDAVGDDSEALTSKAEADVGLQALTDYMSSVGVFAVEQDRRSAPLYRKREEYTRDLEQRVALDEEELKRREEHMDALGSRLQVIETQFKALEHELSIKEEHIERAGAHVLEVESSLRNTEALLKENEAYVRGVESALELAESALGLTESARAEAEAYVTKLESALTGAESARAEAEAYVTKLESALIEADSARAETEAYVRKVETSLNESKSEAEFALHEAWTRVAHLEAERDLVRAELAQVSARLAETDAKAQELEALVQAIRNRKAYRLVAGVIDQLPVRRV
jgi:chromosome segregation ATPase